MHGRRLAIRTGLAIFSALANPFDVWADETGVSSDSILFGQAAALEGPSSALGQGMRQGILAAFAEINAKGGVHGRKLKLISRDDGYDPDRSVAQSTKLIEEDKVFALIGAVGTPTTTATVPIAKAKNVPFIGPFTGAGFLRAPELDNVVNISFVGAIALARELGPEGQGVIVSQVVPFPWDTSVKVVADYQAAEKALDPNLKPDFVSLEGYLSGRLVASALQQTGPNPTRADMLKVINDVGRFDISGTIITFEPRTHAESGKVFLTVIRRDGTFKAVEKL